MLLSSLDRNCLSILIDSPGTHLSNFMLQNLKKNSTGNETLDEFELTREQQKKLFEITYAREEAETKRLVKKYFNIEWKKLHPKIQQILVDLKFRGDFRPTSKAEGQKALKAAVEANDLEKFKKVFLNCVHMMLVQYKDCRIFDGNELVATPPRQCTFKAMYFDLPP